MPALFSCLSLQERKQALPKSRKLTLQWGLHGWSFLQETKGKVPLSPVNSTQHGTSQQSFQHLHFHLPAGGSTGCILHLSWTTPRNLRKTSNRCFTVQLRKTCIAILYRQQLVRSAPWFYTDKNWLDSHMPFKSWKFNNHERILRYGCSKFCPDSSNFRNAIQSLVLVSSLIVPDEFCGSKL